MAIPINIEDLLNKRKIESNRIEFKTGWNPVSIYHSICAFANDIDNLGGGYILVGVKEKNGIAERPVEGIPIEKLDSIQKQMVNLNHLIEPYYQPRISVEEVDGKYVLAIWVPSGTERPYTVPADVMAKLKKPVFYVRYGTSSIEAVGDTLDQLREISAKVPFDDRGNDNISYNDISLVQLRDYLVKVGSKLSNDVGRTPIEELLSNMNLLAGPIEQRRIKNVAAMMFCEQPDKFFPYSQVEIVFFPEGRERNPDNMTEAPVIKGTVPHMINATLDYLSNNVIKERIIKVRDKQEPIKYFNYPYAALEESVTNALYHRDYRLYEPVEITIEPHRISILSYAGPDRSISAEAIRLAKSLRSRRYKNRRLGDFLKELGLTEGRATGIPTIQAALEANGSPRATIETDNDRTYFLIDIPCHPTFIGEPFNIKTSSDETANELKDILKDVYYVIKEHPYETMAQLAERVGIGERALKARIDKLKKAGYIGRKGRRHGYWIVLK
jgi:ATP-dependent DNA helicase RecG